ncbi:cystatin-B-like isoform X2 [Rhea pennata]|uniref:cystatin-B-like isoform X2 n=1 Tax=Rhea pennata TaxID=8795 RepID=UPI002E26A99F
MLCGAPSATRAATSETQQIADEVKPQLEEKEGKTFDVFTAVEFKTQVVAGTNYFIKLLHFPLPNLKGVKALISSTATIACFRQTPEPGGRKFLS